MIKDIYLAIKYFDVYSFLAKQDIKSRFRGSKLGVIWIVIQQLVYAFGVGFIWSNIFGINASEFIPFITIGIAIWNFVSSAVVDGSYTFILAHGYIKQTPIPQSIFIFRTLCTQSMYLIVSILCSFFVMLVFNKLHILGIIYAIPGLLILILYFYGAAGSMAYLGLRFRDLQHAVSSIFGMLFILTPIVYPPEILIKKGIPFVVYCNPFASLIEIVRYPLLNNLLPDMIHYCVSIGFTILLIILRFSVAKKWERYVPFWS